MKKFLAATAIIFLLAAAGTCSAGAVTAATPTPAPAADYRSLLEGAIDKGDAAELDDNIEKFSAEDYKKVIGDFNTESAIRDMSTGKFTMDIGKWFQNLLAYLFKEIYGNLGVMLKIFALVIAAAVLRNLQASFMQEGTSELAFYVCYIVIITVLVTSFKSALDLASTTIDSMVGFMHATIPTLTVLLAAGGNLVSAGVFKPILVALVELTSFVMGNVFVPLVLMSAALTVVSHITDKVNITRLAVLIKTILVWSLGLFLTVFIAIVTIQGLVSGAADGITGKATKYAVGTFIPVVGKYLADATDTVIGCALLIKNATGVAMMIGVLAVCLVPIIKIASIMLIFRATTALSEPIADKRITQCMSDMAGSLTFVLGMVACQAFMFLLTVTVIIGAANISAAVR